MLTGIGPDGVLDVPFPHHVRVPALPEDEYAALAADVPSLELALGGRPMPGSNVAVRLSAAQVLTDARMPARWKAFFAHHVSDAWWRQIVRVFAPSLRRAFPELEARVGRPYEAWRVRPRDGSGGDADVRLDCQFVWNTPVLRASSVKTPHVDVGAKIFSALFYLRDPADGAAGGDLDLYRWRRAPRFVKHRALARDVELVKTVRYGPNTFVAFVNAPAAVHGVSPRSPTAVPRRYVNFIAEIPGTAFVAPQAPAWRRLLHRVATRPH